MRATLVVAAALLATTPAQDSVEIRLLWGFPDKVAAEYAVSELRGGKPVPRPGQSFVLFPADLNADGSNNLTINTCQELPLRVALRLPDKPVKPGSRWEYKEDFFDAARHAFAKSHAFAPRGVQTFTKIEEINGRKCARIESTVKCYDLKFDTRDRRDVGTSELATIRAVAWFSIDNTVPVRLQTSFSGRVSEYKGIKQGEEPKSAKADEQLQFDLAKDFIKLDLVATRDSVHAAIRKGAEWLKKNREKSGQWIDSGGSFAREFPVGTTALCVMALLHAGVPREDPAVRDGLAVILRANLSKVYDVGASLMALEAKYLPLEQYEEVVELTEEKARKAIAEKMTPQDKAWVQKAVDWLLARQTKDGTWGYPDAVRAPGPEVRRAMRRENPAPRLAADRGALDRLAEVRVRRQGRAEDHVDRGRARRRDPLGGVDRARRVGLLHPARGLGEHPRPGPGLRIDGVRGADVAHHRAERARADQGPGRFAEDARGGGEAVGARVDPA